MPNMQSPSHRVQNTYAFLQASGSHRQNGIIVHRCHHNHQTQPWLYVLLNLLITHSFDTWATTCLSRFTASKREESTAELLKHPPLRNLILPATQAGIDLDLMPNILCGISNILRDIRKSPLSQDIYHPLIKHLRLRMSRKACCRLKFRWFGYKRADLYEIRRSLTFRTGHWSNFGSSNTKLWQPEFKKTV